jgi:hypothetical protein
MVSLDVNESVSVYVDYGYSQAGNYTVRVYATNGPYFGERIMEIEIPELVSLLEVRNPSVLEVDGRKAVFGFEIINLDSIILDDVTWVVDTGESVIFGTESMSLEPLESVTVVVEYLYSDYGNYVVTMNASGDIYHYSQTMGVEIPEIHKLDIKDFSVLHTHGKRAVIGFEIKNTDYVILDDVRWTVDTGESVVSGTSPVTLYPGESAMVVFEYTYSGSGNYTVSVHASSGSYEDVESVGVEVIEIPEVEVRDLGVLDVDDREVVFGFGLRNGMEFPADVTWSMDTGESSIIGVYPIILEADEEVFVYVNHVYPGYGNYTVSVTGSADGFNATQQIEVSI